MNTMISIIVPIYNCEKYVSECISSVLKQTYCCFELILLNDGSTDGSEQLCYKFAAQDSRIKVVSHPNMGVSKNRRKGLEMATADIITFIDSDDRIQPDYLEVLINEFEKNKADIVCCNSIDSGVYNTSIESSHVCESKSEWIGAYYTGKRYAYCIWGKLYRKQLLIETEFPDMKYAEDTYIVLNVFEKAKRIVLLNYYGYLYTDNPNGAMRTSKGIQNSYDVLQLAVEMHSKYANMKEFQSCAERQLVNAVFNTIASGSGIAPEELESKKDFINWCITRIDRKTFIKSKKGIVVWLYKKNPNAVMKLLRTYRKIKKMV